MKLNYEYSLGAHECTFRIRDTITQAVAAEALETFIDTGVRPLVGTDWRTTRVSFAGRGQTTFSQYPHMSIQGSAGLSYNSETYPSWLAWSPIGKSAGGSRFSFDLFGMPVVINRRMRIATGQYGGAYDTFLNAWATFNTAVLCAIDGQVFTPFPYLNLVMDDGELDDARGK